MTFSIIQKLQLEEALRLDAEYFKPEFLRWENIIQKMVPSNFEDLLTIKGGKRLPLGENFSEEGIPYIRAEDVKNGFIEYLNSPLISEELHSKLRSYQTKLDDVLITIVGNSIGDVGLVKFNLKKCNLTENCAKLICKKSILPEYLFVFLLSEFGQYQIKREKVGTTQPKLSLDRIRKMKVVVLPEGAQKDVKNIICKAEDYADSSKSFYSQAEYLLLEELGLNCFTEENDLFSIINLSEVQSVNRIDAEYFQRKYKKLIEKISSQNYKKLGDLVNMKKGFEPGSESYQEEGKLFVRVSNLTKLGLNEGNQQYINEELYNKLKTNFEPKIGEILLSKDATPGIAYTIKEPIKGIVSGGILRLEAKNDIEAEYLSLVISSIVGKMQVERDAGGSIIAHWKPEQIKNILIPVLPKETQQKIADLVRQSHIARKKSKELLEEAKKKVEEMIEKGDE